MSGSTPPPEQWRPLYDAIGVEFGYRPLASRIGMEHTRVRRVLRSGRTSIAAIELVAEGFGVAPQRIQELRGDPTDTQEPFVLPDDARWLNDKEREVVRSVKRALLDARGVTA